MLNLEKIFYPGVYMLNVKMAKRKQFTTVRMKIMINITLFCELLMYLPKYFLNCHLSIGLKAESVTAVL